MERGRWTIDFGVREWGGGKKRNNSICHVVRDLMEKKIECIKNFVWFANVDLKIFEKRERRRKWWWWWRRKCLKKFKSPKKGGFKILLTYVINKEENWIYFYLWDEIKTFFDFFCTRQSWREIFGLHKKFLRLGNLRHPGVVSFPALNFPLKFSDCKIF